MVFDCGHSTCSVCVDRLHAKCPICRARINNTRSKAELLIHDNGEVYIPMISKDKILTRYTCISSLEELNPQLMNIFIQIREYEV